MNDPQFDVGQKPEGAAQNPYEAGFTPEPPPAQRGCFFYGCIIAVVLSVLALIAVAALVYMGYYYYSKMIQEWTATAPAPIESVSLPEDRQKELDDRIAAFKKALDNGEAADMVLTADEINAEIAKNNDLKGKVFVSIDGDQISGKLSIPLGDTGLPGTKGRYFNGSGSFSVSLDDGELVVIARELEANGKKLPPEVKTQLAKENLAKNFMSDPDTYKYIRKFESIKVKDGKVYIKARARHKEEESEADKAKEKAEGKEGDEAKEKAEGKEKPKDPDKKPDGKPAPGDAKPRPDQSPAQDAKPRPDQSPAQDAKPRPEPDQAPKPKADDTPKKAAA